MKNKLHFFAMLFIACSFSILVNAQLKVADNGNVGICVGNNTPASNLTVGSTAGLANAKIYVTWTGNSSGTRYGVYSSLVWGQASNTKYAIYGLSQALGGTIAGVKGEASSTNGSSASITAYGVYGTAGNANNGKNYGVYGELKSGSNGAGVFGTNTTTLPTISSRYAGYFYGNAYVNGTAYYVNQSQTSDARLKTNVKDINADALSKVKELRPVQYQWKQVEDVRVEDTITIKTPHFSEDVDLNQTHYGFLAQEVLKLFPELVNEDGAGYLSVNYVELIPLLIQAVQELSVEVEELKSSDISKKRIAASKSSNEQSVLFQNKPNPFTIDTKIEYQLPETTQSATLYIYNANGLQVAEYPILTFGTGNVIVSASTLDAGMYLYSLVADNQVIDTKRMILTK